MLKTALLLANVLSHIVTLIFGVFGIYEQIMGPEDAKKWLKKRHIPLSYRQVLCIGFTSLAVLFVSHILLSHL